MAHGADYSRATPNISLTVLSAPAIKRILSWAVLLPNKPDMKNAIMIILLLAGMAGTVQAQHGKGKQFHRNRAPSPEQKAQRKTARIDKVVHLTPAQRKAVYKSNLRTAKKMDIARKHASDNRYRMMMAYHQQNAELRRILTPQQYRKYTPYSREWKQKRNTRLHDPRGMNHRMSPRYRG